MIVKDLPDITPNGVATPLVANNVKTDARWVQLTANPAATTLRYGGSTVSASRGSRLFTSTPAQIGFGFQEGQGTYDLSQIYVFGTGSDAVSISFGV